MKYLSIGFMIGFGVTVGISAAVFVIDFVGGLFGVKPLERKEGAG